MTPYVIGVGVVLTAEGAIVALCVERLGQRKLLRWASTPSTAHAAALEGVERALALQTATEAPREILLRQQSVVSQLRSPAVRWSSERAPEGEHPVVTAACRHAQA